MKERGDSYDYEYERSPEENIEPVDKDTRGPYVKFMDSIFEKYRNWREGE